MIASIAGINTSAEILFSSYPPAAPAPSDSQKTASLLFKDYNLKMINKQPNCSNLYMQS
jgi:hypothetical protein